MTHLAVITLLSVREDDIPISYPEAERANLKVLIAMKHVVNWFGYQALLLPTIMPSGSPHLH